MDTSQVQGRATNAVPEWTKKQGLPSILTIQATGVTLRTTEQANFRQGLIVIDIQVRTALDRFSESPCQQIK